MNPSLPPKVSTGVSVLRSVVKSLCMRYDDLFKQEHPVFGLRGVAWGIISSEITSDGNDEGISRKGVEQLAAQLYEDSDTTEIMEGEAEPSLREVVREPEWCVISGYHQV
jgi:hypothetical protein